MIVAPTIMNLTILYCLVTFAVSLELKKTVEEYHEVTIMRILTTSKEIRPQKECIGSLALLDLSEVGW